MRGHPDWNHNDVLFAQSKAYRQMLRDRIPRMDKTEKPFKGGDLMDRLSRFYRAKMEGDLPVAISPPVEFQRQDEGRYFTYAFGMRRDTRC
jgi:hypothetical protein